MPKRKSTRDESEEDTDSSTVDSPNPAPLPRRVRDRGQKLDDSSQSDSEKEDAPLSKKAKKDSDKTTTAKNVSSEASFQTNSSGEKFIDLGKKKRATVRIFKGIPLIDIREYYDAKGEEKPGKKGISLTVDQWEALKKGSSLLDDALSTSNNSTSKK